MPRWRRSPLRDGCGRLRTWSCAPRPRSSGCWPAPWRKEDGSTPDTHRRCARRWRSRIPAIVSARCTRWWPRRPAWGCWWESRWAFSSRASWRGRASNRAAVRISRSVRERARRSSSAGRRAPQTSTSTSTRRTDEMEVRFLGHACFELAEGDTRVLIDPFLTGNPRAAIAAEDVNPSVIVLTHGHGDHFGDTIEIAKRTGAPVVAIVEIANEVAEEGEQTFDPNMGGTVKFDWGWVKLVPAWHTSTTPKGTVSNPAGVVVSLGGAVVYHLGDTALFSDLQLVGKRHPIDLALMCIGGHYTMDSTDAVDAAQLVGAKTVIPCHYNTFPAIEADAEAFKSDVESATGSNVVILEPGEAHTL